MMNLQSVLSLILLGGVVAACGGGASSPEPGASGLIGSENEVTQSSTPVAPPAGCGGSTATNAAGAVVIAGYLQTGTGLEAFSIEVCTSPDGVHWSGPTAIALGTNPAAAIAPNGQAVVIWQGGPATSPDIQASVLPPGGSWSAPVNVSADPGHPQISMDGSGNAIAIWSPNNLDSAVQTASLPAGGHWTTPQTLVPNGGGVSVATNSSGDAIVSWRTRTTNDIQAASGTVLHGIGAPLTFGVTNGYALHPAQAAINSAGQAVLAWESVSTGNSYAIRTAAGAWSGATQFSSKPSVIHVAVNGAGNFAITWTNSAGTVETLTVPS